MKMYLTPEQTAKLIELGFEKPKMAAPALKWVDGEPTFEPQYTIGELLSFLPKKIKVKKYDEPAYIQILYDDDEEDVWEVGYTFYGNGMYIKRETEFIDCIFQMFVKLKEEGVI